MNSNSKRTIAIAAVIVVAVIIVIAVIFALTSTKSMTVSEAASAPAGQNVSIEGNVSPNTYDYNDGTLTFDIYDPDNTNASVTVEYKGDAPQALSNDGSATVSGKTKGDGVIEVTEVSATSDDPYLDPDNALSVKRLNDYGESFYGKSLVVRGKILKGTLETSSNGSSFTLLDTSEDSRFPVVLKASLPSDVTDSSIVTLTGAFDNEGTFRATHISLD